MKGCRTIRTASSSRHRSRAATSCSSSRPSERLNIRCIPDPALDPDAAAQRPAGVPLLRPVRSGLCVPRQFLVAVGAAATRARDQAPHDCHERHGPRGHGGRRWPGDGRDLHRQEHRPRESCAGAHRGDGRERVRDGAIAAQLEVGALPARPRQLERRRRQVPHGHDRHERPRLHPEDDEQRAAQRRRRQRITPVHAVVGRQQEARFPARVSHRARRWTAHARLRQPRRSASVSHDRRRRRPGVGRRLRQATERRLPPLLRRHGGLRGSRRNDPQRAFVLRNRSNGRGSLGHSRAALPLEVDRLRAQASQAHAGDVPLHHP